MAEESISDKRSSVSLVTEDNSTKRSKKKLKIPHLGIIYGILSSLFFTFNAVFAKLVSLHPVEIALSRCYLQYIILLPILMRTKTLDDMIGPRESRIYLWMRGLAGSISGLLFYLSVGNLSAGNAVTLSFLDIVFVPILGRIFFKESLTIMDTIFALVAFCGVVLIAKPPFIFHHSTVKESENAIGVLYAVLGAICASLSYLSIRKLGKQTHYFITIFYYSFIGAVLNSILLPITGQFQYPCLLDVMFLGFMMVAGLLGQITLTLALQRERAGTVAVLLTLQIIIVYLVQVIVLQDYPSTLSLIGSGLIFSTSICVGLRKLVNERRRRGSLAKESE